MKKSLMITLAVILIFPFATASSVDNVEFEEVPSAWEVGEDLEFSMEASGDELDNIRFQSRESGGLFFSTQETIYCRTRDTCEGTVTHTEHSEGTWEYRFRGFAGEDRENSGVQEVTYYNNLEYSVSWINRPPEEASEGDNVEMSVRATDSADRFDTEGSLHIEYREDGEWWSIDSRDCSSSSTSDTCSLSTDTELDQFKIEDGEAVFRGLVVFRGDVTATSEEHFIDIVEDASVDSVTLDSLPSRHPVGDDLQITGEASGEELDVLELQKKEPGDDWEYITDTGCRGSSCSIDHDYSHSSTEDVDFRLKAEAGSDEGFSDEQTVTFYRPDSIDSVSIEDLPSEWDIGQELDIEASAEGENLDYLEVQVSDRGESDWDRVERRSCSGSSCSFTASYVTYSEQEKDFRARVQTESGDSDVSGIREVDFIDDFDRVDSVTLDSLPSRHPVNDELEISGEASGDRITDLTIQYRESGGSWSQLASKDCSRQGRCSISDNFRAAEDGRVDFRLRAETDDDTRYSSSKRVDFYTERRIDSVSMDDFPSNFDVGRQLDISGEASGRNLDELRIITRAQSEISWDRIAVKDCGGSDNCEIEEQFTASEAEGREFAVRAKAGRNDRSSVRQFVDFRETQQPEVDSVTLDSLPSQAPVNERLTVSAQASGTELDDLEIQFRRNGDWERAGSTTCSGSSCSFSTGFETDTEEDIEFKAVANAGADTAESISRTVEFVASPDPSVDSVTIDSLPDTFHIEEALEISGQASGIELDSIEIQKRDENDWIVLESSSCSGSTCSINADYTETEEKTVDFRVKAEAGNDEGFSNTETVEFIDSDTPQQPEVTSVTLSELPRFYDAGPALEMTAEASGRELEQLRILERPISQISWTQIASSSCTGSSCELKTSYSSEEEQTVEFRAQAFAGDDDAYSMKRVVEFRDEEDEDDNGDNGDNGDDEFSDAELNVNVEDMSGNSLRNVRVEASNGENKVKYTDRRGNVDFSLESGRYDVEASREGYVSETQRVNLRDGEEESIDFRLDYDGFPVRIVSLNAPETICEGDSLEVNAVLSNLRDTDQSVAVNIRGDERSRAQILDLEAEGAGEATLVIDSVEGVGEKNLFVRAQRDGYHDREFTVTVEDCDDQLEAETGPTGISINARQSTISGETVRISGEVQGVRTSRDVRIAVNGETRDTVTSSRRGSYQAFVQLNEPGITRIKAETEAVSAQRTVRVHPGVNVNPVQAPVTVVEGENFEVCAEIESSAQAREILERNGEVVDSRDASGETCFQRTESNSGNQFYRIRAVTSGSGSSASQTVNVIPDEREIESFPDRISTSVSDSGLARINIYNRDTSIATYDVEISGVNSRDVSQTSKTEVIAPGKRESVYIYFSPRESSTATVDIYRNREHVDKRTLDIRAVQRPPQKRGLLSYLGF